MKSEPREGKEKVDATSARQHSPLQTDATATDGSVEDAVASTFRAEGVRILCGWCLGGVTML